MTQKRKNIRLPQKQYEIPSRIFSVTICTFNRRPLFQDENYAKMIINLLRSGPFAQKTQQYAVCLMPDHLHMMISPVIGNLVDSINRWKSYTANLLMKNGNNGACWQRGFYDHALRKEEDIQVVAEYIVNNPVRSGIVKQWQDYHFSWHMWMPETQESPAGTGR